jgi:hypothetical protein
MVLYEIGILGAYLVSRKNGTREASVSHPA